MPPAPARLDAPALTLLALCALGCANPGQPRPPSLHIPALATTLRAQRIGPSVHLTWSTPAESTDGQALRGPITAVVCRDLQAAPRPAPQPARSTPDCHRVSSFPVIPGASAADDPLPASLLTGPPTLLTYRIQLFNAAGHSAAHSAPAYSAAGSAPAPLGPVAVTSSRQGAIVTWTPGPDPSPVEIRRTLVPSPVRPVLLRPGQPATPEPTAPARKPEPQAVTLRAGSPVTSDPGGLFDPSVRPLSTYSYTAQRIRTAYLLTPSGSSIPVDLRGLPSQPVLFTDRDLFPPPPPAGLLAIATPGDPATPAENPPSINLSWEPGLEPDLLGYNVYRAGSPQGPFRRLNPTPLPGPAFRDLDVQLRHTYLYQVTAVDRTGNESPPSKPLPETVPQP